jgi:putative hemolysin
VNGLGGQLALVGFLIVLSAAFAGSEIALISLREGQLARLEQRSMRGRVLARLVREPNRFLSTIQIGIILAGFLASATAAVALAEPLVEPLGFLGRAARPAAIFAITLGLTFITLVFGELAPKRLAIAAGGGMGAAGRPSVDGARTRHRARDLAAVARDRPHGPTVRRRSGARPSGGH